MCMDSAIDIFTSFALPSGVHSVGGIRFLHTVFKKNALGVEKYGEPRL